jgi:hypothetical protein
LFGVESEGGRSGCLGLDHAQDVAFLHDQQVFAVQLDLGARPLAEQDAVAGLDVEGDDLALVVRAPGPTETTSPSCGFSLAVSGMMIPPLVLDSSSTRFTSTRSPRGRNFMGVLRRNGFK